MMDCFDCSSIESNSFQFSCRSVIVMETFQEIPLAIKPLSVTKAMCSPVVWLGILKRFSIVVNVITKYKYDVA